MQTKTTRRDFIVTLAATAAVPLLAKAGEPTLVAPAVAEKGTTFSPLDLFMAERSKVISRTTSFSSRYTFWGDIFDSIRDMLNELKEYTDGAFDPRSSECMLTLPAFGFDYPPPYLEEELLTDCGDPTTVLSVIKGFNPNMHIEYYDGEDDIAKLHYTDAGGTTWGIMSIAVADIVHREIQ